MRKSKTPVVVLPPVPVAVPNEEEFQNAGRRYGRVRIVTLQQKNGKTFQFDTDLLIGDIRKMYPKHEIIRNVFCQNEKASNNPDEEE